MESRMELKELSESKFLNSVLGQNSEKYLSQREQMDKPFYIENNKYKNCPLENGSWKGERGDSTWLPESDFVPKKANPEGKTWKEILNSFGIEGIPFKDGEPDFSEICKGEVKIEGFSDSRDDNFDKADIALAKERGCTPQEVRQWRKENGYTWHECRDMETMQKVPSIVHNNVTHSGGISEKKKEA